VGERERVIVVHRREDVSIIRWQAEERDCGNRDVMAW
jgi:hypothetical protein